MKTHTLLFSLLIILSFNYCSEEEKNTIVGQWEPVSRYYNVGSTLIFKEDSTIIQIRDAKVNYTYELAGDTLISTSFSGLTGEKIIDSAKITITGDTLILVRGKPGDMQETVMKKYDSLYTLKDTIIGVWKWPHSSGREAVSVFHPDGKATVYTSIERREGKYSIKNDSLTVVFPGTSYHNLKFELKGDTLTFPEKFAPMGKAFYRVREDEKQ